MFAQTEKRGFQFKVGKTYEIDFPYTDLTIESMSASCGCSELSDVRTLGLVRVKYKAQDIPPHLRNVGHYLAQKFVTISYHTNEDPIQKNVILTFEGTVTD